MATDFRLKDQLPKLTQRIVQTYDEVGKINHLGHCPLPNYDEIIAATGDLKEILYPGYRRREGLHRGNVAYYVGDLVDRLHDRFTQQIGRALRHEAGATDDCDNDHDFEALGQAKTMLFLERLPEVRKTLATDVQAAYDGDPACKSLDEVIFCYPGLEAITVYRLAHVLYELDIPFIPRMMTEWAHSSYRHRYPPGRQDRPAFLHRSRHGCRNRRNNRDRRARQAVSRCDARSVKLQDRRRRPTCSRD